ncbi:hypothetical protein glysoja_022631, partial [Glycine soja]
LFVFCPFAKQVWQGILNWLGYSFSLPNNIQELYLQLGMNIRGKKKRRFKHLLWHNTCWSIWCHRNNVIFRNAEVDVNNTILFIKSMSWQWVLYKSSGKPGFFFSSWCLCPLDCL